MAKGIKYNHNSETISEIKKKVDFTILTPRKIPDDWTLEIKTTPWISLHYMDSNDTKMMVDITLRRGLPISDEDFLILRKLILMEEKVITRGGLKVDKLIKMETP